MLLSELPDGLSATVQSLAAASMDLDAAALRRLAELGFLPGEPVQVLRRGPGGREPAGRAAWATRCSRCACAEARCIEVLPGA